jgi:tetratricopeptide (TPR) repeat protein
MRKRFNYAMVVRSLAVAVLVVGWCSIGAQGQTPSTIPPALSISPETLHYFAEYKRITHLMEQKEISREALAAFDRAVDAVLAGKVGAAMDALEEALRTDIKKEESRVLWSPYSQLISDQGQFKRGLEFLQNISLQQPKLAYVHTFLASTYGMYAGWLKDRDRQAMLRVSNQSLDEYEVSLALDPNSFQALMGHAIYLSYVPGKEMVWEAEFRKLLAMRPADTHGFPFSSVYYAFIEGLIRSGQEDRARLVLNEGLKLYPKSAGLLELDGKLTQRASK